MPGNLIGDIITIWEIIYKGFNITHILPKKSVIVNKQIPINLKSYLFCLEISNVNDCENSQKIIIHYLSCTIKQLMLLRCL